MMTIEQIYETAKSMLGSGMDAFAIQYVCDTLKCLDERRRFHLKTEMIIGG